MCVKQGEASVTSLVSAFSRAYHSEFDNPKIFDDYVAKEFISQKNVTILKRTWFKGFTFQYRHCRAVSRQSKRNIKMDYASSVIANTFSACRIL